MLHCVNRIVLVLQYSKNVMENVMENPAFTNDAKNTFGGFIFNKELLLIIFILWTNI